MSEDTFIDVGTPRAQNAIEVNTVKLSNFRGMVCLTFEKRCDCLTLTAQEALTMGEALSRQSYRAHHGDFPDGKTKQTTEQLRLRARNRVIMLLKNEPKTPEQKKIRATSIVDEVMKLVT